MATGAETKERKPLIKRLKSHYKLVVLNIETFEERFALLLSPFNVIVLGSISIGLLVVLTFLLLGWTPIRYYLPHYSQEMKVKKLALRSAQMADSLEVALQQRDLYINNLRGAISGTLPVTEARDMADKGIAAKVVEFVRGPEDSALRTELEADELVNLSAAAEQSSRAAFLLFPPVKGTVVQRFNPQREHFGLDLAAEKDAPIMAVDEGSVVLAAYTAETGYVIQIQHSNQLLSVYKHNSVLLKKAGDKVRAGEAIAVIGETGEFSSGPHLHFELWQRGVALNPELYFAFD